LSCKSGDCGGVVVLRLLGGQVESLFDLGVPVAVAEMPADLAALDGLLAGPGVFLQIRWWTEDSESWSHLLVDVDYPALAGVRSVGHARTETESWTAYSDSFYDATGIRL
jgi:hypothetical protein